MDVDGADVFSVQEIEALIKARLAAGPATEAELEAVLEWARETRVENALLELVLAGEVRARWRDGRPVVFTAAPQRQKRRSL